jgi:ectoine hydroxylase-related dioxygenase (phytanoyl-CoA dioxygenase family)
MLLEKVEQAVARRREIESKGITHTGMTNLNGENTRLFYILDDDPAFLDLMDDVLIMPYITGLLHEKPHFSASDINLETEEGTGGFWWHLDGHDDGYRKLRPDIPLLQLKVGYYLTDMTEPDQGNLMLVPGSHHFPEEPPEEHKKEFETFPGAIQVCAPAGSAFLFHNAVWHTRGPWTKPDGRRIIVYFAYDLPWMVSSAEHWSYPQTFYDSLSPKRRALFHGFVFDPPEHRWG